MSLASWSAEFYPHEPKVADAIKRGSVQSIEHSLRKWEGALVSNARKHGMEYNDWRIVERQERNQWISPKSLGFDSKSCSLCAFSTMQPGASTRLSASITKPTVSCSICPIVVAGEPSCNGEVGSRGRDPAYEDSEDTATPMVKTLRKVLKFYRANPHQALVDKVVRQLITSDRTIWQLKDGRVGTPMPATFLQYDELRRALAAGTVFLSKAAADKALAAVAGTLITQFKEAHTK